MRTKSGYVEVSTIEAVDKMLPLEYIQLQPLRGVQKDASYTKHTEAIMISVNNSYGSV
jgi:hypothetical protein